MTTMPHTELVLYRPTLQPLAAVWDEAARQWVTETDTATVRYAAALIVSGDDLREYPVILRRELPEFMR